MEISFQIKDKSYRVDLNRPIDVSIPLTAGANNVNAWYCDPVRIEPVRMGEWIGDVNSGGSVNFRNIYLNPHGNGTHTECMGHISKENFSLNEELKTFFFLASVITLTPVERGLDTVLMMESVDACDIHPEANALLIRTNPNDAHKLTKQYSNSNPTYLEVALINKLVEMGIDHLLLDLPSVDRERDEGKLDGHHAFWRYPSHPRHGTTITELIYVPNEVPDGHYLLNLMITSLVNDASPSKPVLYRLLEGS
jgi:kynurenine formamidase